MTSTKKRKFYTTNAKSRDRDPKFYEHVGDEFEDSARAHFKEGKYREVSLDHRNALDCYRKALDFMDERDPSKGDLYEKISVVKDLEKNSRKTAALHKATKKYNPLVRRLIRFIKGVHIIILFAFSLLFLVPNLTGNVIGNGFKVPILGMLFFFLGIVFCYLFALKNLLINRFVDQY